MTAGREPSCEEEGVAGCAVGAGRRVNVACVPRHSTAKDETFRTLGKTYTIAIACGGAIRPLFIP